MIALLLIAAAAGIICGVAMAHRPRRRPPPTLAIRQGDSATVFCSRDLPR